MQAVDAITQAVVGAALGSVAEEAGTALRKTAYSQAVREGRDFSVALFDARGQMIVQGDFSPGHLGSMPSLVRHVLAEYPASDLGPGDAIVLNDLYMGSGHLPDFFLTTPVFHRDQLVGYVVNCAHQVDVGGAAAGSQAVEGVTEFYQEGIRVLPCKLWRAGEVNREVMRLITGNVRMPDIVEGDLKAMRNSGASANAACSSCSIAMARIPCSVPGRRSSPTRSGRCGRPSGRCVPGAMRRRISTTTAGATPILSGCS